MKAVDAISHHTGRLLEMRLNVDVVNVLLQHTSVMPVDHLL